MFPLEEVIESCESGLRLPVNTMTFVIPIRQSRKYKPQRGEHRLDTLIWCPSGGERQKMEGTHMHVLLGICSSYTMVARKDLTWSYFQG